MYKGTLPQVLKKIGEQLSLPVDKLIEYADDAPYAATRPDGNLWPSGTGSISEKRILYAIARAINPMLSLDLGTRWGAMALQVISGNDDAAEIETWGVVSVDIEKTIHGSKQPVGKFIPQQYSSRIEFLNSDVIRFLSTAQNEYGLIFEDTDHTYETTKAIYELAVDRLVPGGVIISHDAVHPKFENAVVQGISTTGVYPNVYLVEGDSCGLAIWQKPIKPDTGIKWQAETTIMEDLHDNAKTNTKTAQEKPKRRKRRRKKASKIKADLESGKIVVGKPSENLTKALSDYRYTPKTSEEGE